MTSTHAESKPDRETTPNQGNQNPNLKHTYTLDKHDTQNPHKQIQTTHAGTSRHQHTRLGYLSSVLWLESGKERKLRMTARLRRMWERISFGGCLDAE
ncbi:hypothetical protein Droror1_Dr00009111 [Drosera rotundifolia]